MKTVAASLKGIKIQSQSRERSFFGLGVKNKRKNKKYEKSQYLNNKTVKVPVLDETNFCLFQSKFKSDAAIKGFAEALELGFASKLPARESDVSASSEQDKKKQRNVNDEFGGSAFYLAVSFEREEHLGFIKDARTEDWPSRPACKILKNTENNF